MAKKIRRAKPSNLSKSAIEKLSEEIARELDFTKDSDLIDLVTELGGLVSVSDEWQDNESAGSLIVKSPTRFEIRVPSHTSVERDRFTIAHELGHYFVHYLLAGMASEENIVFEARRYGSKREEWEANWFAAAFLMPENEFRTTFAEFHKNIVSVARNFEVSRGAAETRAKSLGLM